MVRFYGDLLQENLCHTQVCFNQIPCPCGRPPPICTYTGDAQTQVSRSYCAQGLFDHMLYWCCGCSLSWAKWNNSRKWMIVGNIWILNQVWSDQGIKPASLVSPALVGRFFTTSAKAITSVGCLAEKWSTGYLTLLVGHHLVKLPMSQLTRIWLPWWQGWCLTWCMVIVPVFQVGGMNRERVNVKSVLPLCGGEIRWQLLESGCCWNDLSVQ